MKILNPVNTYSKGITMQKKLIFTTVCIVLFLPALAIASDSAMKQSVTKAFSDYQQAIETKNYKQAWDCYSANYQRENTFNKLKKRYDKNTRSIISGLMVLEINPTSSTTATLKTRMSGSGGKFVYYRFVFEDESWKIQEEFQSRFSRPPRRGYRPDDISKQDENTQKEITAVQKLSLKFLSNLSKKDFRTAWECMGNKRLTYDIFMNSGMVRVTQERESMIEYWDSLLVLEIKISENKATVDLGPIKDGAINMIFILDKTDTTWKIMDMISTDSRVTGEEKLPSLYFERS